MLEDHIIKCETAAEFIGKLRPSNPRWLPKHRYVSSWVFRGQKLAEYPLVPSAWREIRPDSEYYPHRQMIAREAFARMSFIEKDHVPHISGEMGEVDKSDKLTAYIKHYETLLFEYHLCEQFVGFVNEIGLTIPGGKFIDFGEHIYSGVDMAKAFDTRPPHSAFALAQHHGIPTRFLDWTRNPLFAAFFAAEEFEKHEPDDLAVWAIDLAASEFTRQTKHEIRAFEVPRAEVGFLHAQQGLFTYMPLGDHLFFKHDGRWPATEDYFPEDGIYKITMPRSQCAELVRLLWAEGVTRAHLMPTHDNITSSLKSLARLQDKLNGIALGDKESIEKAYGADSSSATINSVAAEEAKPWRFKST